MIPFTSGSWTKMQFETYGVRIEIRTDAPELWDLLTPMLPPIREASTLCGSDRIYTFRRGSAHHRLHANGRLLLESADWDDLIERLENDIQIFLGDRSPNMVYLHAGAVAWQGRAIVVPGTSYSGKSTLVAALLRAGATYYSDEYAVLDAGGRVHPYPRLLSLRQPAGKSLRQAAAELGAATGRTAIAPAVFLFTTFKTQASWAPRALDVSQAILETVRHCVPIRRKPGASLDAITRALSQAALLAGPRGEADATAQAVLQRLSSARAA